MSTSPILHVDGTSLAQVKLTGVGRCVARVVECLARKRPIHLFSMAHQEDLARAGHRDSLHQGRVIRLAPENLPAAHQDVSSWRDAVFGLPSSPFCKEKAGKSPAIYTFHRARQRHFGREVSLYHDLTACVVPSTHQKHIRQSTLDLVVGAAPLDDHAVANSRNTRRDLIWLCGLPPERVSWAHLGPSQCIEQHASETMVARDPNLFLAVSTLEPRKNPENLLRWFLTSPNLPRDARLVWAGPSGWLVDRDRLPKASGNRTVTFAGMVSDAALCELYRSARCLVYVSLYEGFGFPVLDALLHGTPVLCSGNSSMVEFAGPGVHFCDPLDIQSMDEAWTSCAAEAGGWNRQDLKQSCSWENVAATLEAKAA